MQKSVSLTLVILLSIGNTALAVPGIDVGSNELLPDTPDQQVNIFVTGGDDVQGLNFRVQVADGFPDVPGSTIDGPNITAVDIVGAGTVFFGNNVGQSSVESRAQAWDQQTVTTDGFVSASGLLARVTFDTTGFTSSMTWDLTLAGGFLGDTNFGLISADITNGSVFIAGEPTQAVPGLTPNPANLGNFHVSDVAQQSFTVSNLADAGAESLNASFGGTTGDVSSATGTVSGLAPGDSNSTNMTAELDTTSAGAKAGTATVNYESVGSGALGPDTVDLTADVYRLAAASSVTPDTIDFGVVHVGDAVSQLLTVANEAPADGFSESLNAAATAGGDATAAGAINQLAAGATDASSLSVGVDTSTAGNKAGLVTLDLASDGTGTSDLGTTPLASQTVNIQAQVNAFANPVLMQIDGDGFLRQTGVGTYTLELGRVEDGGAALFAELELTNDVAMPADELSGDWTVTPSAFELSGFDPFAGLAPGDTLQGLMIGLNSDVTGNFTTQIVLNTSSDPGSPEPALLAPVTLTIMGSIGAPPSVPEPTTFALAILGLAALMLLSIRRRQTRQS